MSSETSSISSHASPTGKQLLESKDYSLDKAKYRYKPKCDLHERADSYNLQYKTLAYLAEERPQKAKEIYQNLYSLDQKLEEAEELVKERIRQKDNDYLIAYEQRMNAIGSDMQMLIKLADERALAAKADRIAVGLEEDLAFFRTHCKLLDSHSKELQSQVNHFKWKLKTSQEAEQFMHDQLIDAKKINKVLMFELDQLKAGATTNPSIQKVTTVPGKEQDPDLHYFSELLLKENEGLKLQLEEHAAKTTILSAQLESQKSQLRDLLRMKKTHLNTRNEMQEIFMTCVNSVKQEISKRQAVNLSFKGKLGQVSNSASVDINNFSGADRRKVIDQLVANENVLLFLYEKLFPPETEVSDPSKLSPVRLQKRDETLLQQRLHVPELPLNKNIQGAKIPQPFKRNRPQTAKGVEFDNVRQTFKNAIKFNE